MQAIPQEIRDLAAYANMWGSTSTPHGRMLYSGPEQIGEFDNEQALEFIAALGVQYYEVIASPEAFDESDGSDLLNTIAQACECLNVLPR